MTSDGCTDALSETHFSDFVFRKRLISICDPLKHTPAVLHGGQNMAGRLGRNQYTSAVRLETQSICISSVTSGDMISDAG